MNNLFWAGLITLVLNGLFIGSGVIYFIGVILVLVGLFYTFR